MYLEFPVYEIGRTTICPRNFSITRDFTSQILFDMKIRLIVTNVIESLAADLFKDELLEELMTLQNVIALLVSIHYMTGLKITTTYLFRCHSIYNGMGLTRYEIISLFFFRKQYWNLKCVVPSVFLANKLLVLICSFDNNISPVNPYSDNCSCFFREH